MYVIARRYDLRLLHGLVFLHVASEDAYKSAFLPPIAKREILPDLVTQETIVDADRAEIASQLADWYFNGQIAELKLSLGFQYLSLVIEPDYTGAVAVALNIYDACDFDIPEQHGRPPKQKLC
jgi:hypothetical protein